MAPERAAAPRGQGLRVAVIAALAVERASLDRHIAGGAVAIHQSGPGPERAAQAARAALASGAQALVSWGLAGGLDPALAPGAVVVPSAVLVDGACFACAADWAAAVRAAARGDAQATVAAGGTLLAVAAPLATPAAKMHAGAATGAVAADMESGAIAAAAANAGVPFVAVRVVVDACGDALPPQAERFIDVRGNLRPLAALGAALTPADWPRLVVLARRYRKANAVLSALAARLAPGGFASAAADAAR